MTNDPPHSDGSQFYGVPYQRRWAWVRTILRQKLTNADKVVAVALAQYVNRENNTAWPAQATLARDTNISSRQIRRSLDKLQQHGWLLKTRGGGGRYGFLGEHVRGFTNVFKLNLPDGEIGNGYWKELKTNEAKVKPYEVNPTRPWATDALRKDS